MIKKIIFYLFIIAIVFASLYYVPHFIKKSKIINEFKKIPIYSINGKCYSQRFVDPFINIMNEISQEECKFKMVNSFNEIFEKYDKFLKLNGWTLTNENFRKYSANYSRNYQKDIFTISLFYDPYYEDLFSIGLYNKKW